MIASRPQNGSHPGLPKVGAASGGPLRSLLTILLTRYLTLLLPALVLPAPAVAQSTDVLLTDEENTVRVVQEYGPSVVAIQITVEGVQVHPLLQPREQEGGGSGFIVDEAGRIVTNFHVVQPTLSEEALANGVIEMRPQASITVSFLGDPDREYPVRVRGANPDFDLALLEFEDPGAAPAVDPLRLGDSGEVLPGQKAIAIGTPFGLHSSVTTGIVSAIERERPGLVGLEIPFIQTDAAINPGNSGGPLLDSDGQVIGVNNAILAPGGRGGFIGVGFAVPSNLLRESMEELVAGGLSGVAAAVAEIPDRPRLGLTAGFSVEDYPPGLRDELGLPEHGLVVTEVSMGGPADQAGIEPATEGVSLAGQLFPVGGDIITEVEGEPLRRIIELQRVILDREAGDTVELTVWRDGRERRVEVTLEVVAP